MKKTPRKNKSGVSSAGSGDFDKYLPLVFAVARKYNVFFPFIENEELVEEGKAGLLEAFSRFDKDKKTAFSTYAWFWVLKRIHEYVNKNISIVDIPLSARKNFTAVKKLVEGRAKAGKNISVGEISQALGIKPDEVTDLLALAGNASNAVSLDAETGDGENIKNYYDLIEDKSRPDVFEEIAQKYDSSLLDGMLSQLSEKETEVLSLRFALGGCADKKMSLKDIAHRLNITPAKVKYFESSALVKLKGMMKNTDEQE